MKKLIMIAALLAVNTPAHATGALSPPAALLHQNGFRDCAQAVDQVVKVAHPDENSYAYLSIWATRSANTSVGTALTTVKYIDGQAVHSTSAVKNGAGKCDVVVTSTITLMTQPCPELRASEFKDWKRYSELEDVEAYIDPNNDSHIAIFSPLGLNGCQLMRQLVAYDVEP